MEEIVDKLEPYFPHIVAGTAFILFAWFILSRIEWKKKKKRKPTKEELQRKLYEDIYGLDEKD